MAGDLRVGVLGMTHDHVWSNLRDLNGLSGAKLVAAADPNPELLEKAKTQYSCKNVYESYTEMLDQTDLDAVYVFGDNRSGAELTVMAANRGLHVLVEKPMASTLEGAVAMLAAARTAGTVLMVNWPFLWLPQLQKAMTMAHAGEIGTLTGTRYRSAHQGPKELGCTPYFYNWLYDAELNGAGALMDYCCYGAALARYMLGQPSRVNGTVGHLAKDYVTVDDNAVIVMQWPRAMAITEASWTQIGHLTSYVAVIYGTEGTLLIEPGAKGRLLLANREHDEGIEIEVPALPAELKSASACFLHHIQSGEPVTGMGSPEVSRDAQEILEAGLLSAINGEAVSLPLSVY